MLGEREINGQHQRASPTDTKRSSRASGGGRRFPFFFFFFRGIILLFSATRGNFNELQPGLAMGPNSRDGPVLPSSSSTTIRVCRWDYSSEMRAH